jgi:hypothetical protein
MYNKEAYLKFKEEHPEKIKEYARKAYLKTKDKNPEKRRLACAKAYEKMKIEKPEQLRQLRCNASKAYYQRNREKVIERVKSRYMMKNYNLEKPLGEIERKIERSEEDIALDEEMEHLRRCEEDERDREFAFLESLGEKPLEEEF